MLKARGMAKRYGDVVALQGVDLDVAAGRIVSLLGRNGAGKTTLLSTIAGLVAPDAGTVEIDGTDVAADRYAAARLIGIAPQDTGIYPVLTVRQNLEFFCDLAGVPRSARRSRAHEVAERLGLAELLDRNGNQLSGGEARRLHTACALVHRPEVLMLDEPTVGADVATRQQLIDAVRAMAAEGAAVIYTTHYLPEVDALDADIVIIDDGRVLARGTREDLIEQHHLGGLRFAVEGRLGTDVLARLGDAADVAITERSMVADNGTPDAAEGGEAGPVEYLATGPVTMPVLLAELGADADRLVSVERNLPDLESVFLAVTGRDLGGDA